MRRSRAGGLLLALALAGAVPVRAQQAPGRRPGSPAPIKYGKWLLLLGAGAMNFAAAGAHSDADRAFRHLSDYCNADQSRCALAPSGAYADPVSEGYYQQSLRDDRRARTWLFTGEATLGAAAALFIWELARPKSEAPNVPFTPKIEFTPRSARLGVSYTW